MRHLLLYCALMINDDVGYGDWKVTELMQEWMNEKWPDKASWEV